MGSWGTSICVATCREAISGLSGPFGPAGDRCSGTLGRRSQFATRPIGESDQDRLLEQADAPDPWPKSIAKPMIGISQSARMSSDRGYGCPQSVTSQRPELERSR